MGRQARANRNKKEGTQARHQDVNGAMRQLRLSLMNMRQLYEGAVQEKIAIVKNLDEIKVMLAAVLLTESDGAGSVEITDDTLELANEIDGIQLEKTDAGLMVFVVMAPAEVPEEPQADDAE